MMIKAHVLSNLMKPFFKRRWKRFVSRTWVSLPLFLVARHLRLGRNRFDAERHKKDGSEA